MPVGIFTSAGMLAGAATGLLSWLLLRPLFGLTETDPASGGRLPRNSVMHAVLGVLAAATVAGSAASSWKAAAFAAGATLFMWTALLLRNVKLKNRRQAVILKELPLLLDYLVLQIEAGHSIQQALMSASKLFTPAGPIHSGLEELNQSLQMGRPITDALENFGRRLAHRDVDISVTAVSQALRHGTPLGRILRQQSTKVREHLILEGEQFANTVSVKILIPLLFFIFPASFLVIFSPVIVSLAGRMP